MWKRAALVAVAVLVAAGVWVGLQEIRRDACFSEGSGPAVDACIGLTLTEAHARAERDGHEVHVLGQDGECADHTSDLRTDRVSVYLEDGEVVRARQF